MGECSVVEYRGGEGVGAIDCDVAPGERFEHGDRDSVTAAKGDFLDCSLGGIE